MRIYLQQLPKSSQLTDFENFHKSLDFQRQYGKCLEVFVSERDTNLQYDQIYIVQTNLCNRSGLHHGECLDCVFQVMIQVLQQVVIRVGFLLPYFILVWYVVQTMNFIFVLYYIFIMHSGMEISPNHVLFLGMF